MASWDWRTFVLLVFIFILIIVIFSDIISHRSPTPPTELPPLTLVLRSMTESPPMNLALPVVLTLTENSPYPPTYTPLSTPLTVELDVNPPHCYEMPHDGIQCLGVIHNPEAEALEKVSLQITLWDQDAELREHMLFALPQKRIPPYSIAPYQVIFTREDVGSSNFGGVMVDFIHADVKPFIPEEIFFEELSAEWQGDIYRLSGTVEHDLEGLITVRLVVSLMDQNQQLMGFRVVELEAVESGKKYPIDIDIMPLWVDDVGGHLVYVELME